MGELRHHTSDTILQALLSSKLKMRLRAATTGLESRVHKHINPCSGRGSAEEPGSHPSRGGGSRTFTTTALRPTVGSSGCPVVLKAIPCCVCHAKASRCLAAGSSPLAQHRAPLGSTRQAAVPSQTKQGKLHPFSTASALARQQRASAGHTRSSSACDYEPAN